MSSVALFLVAAVVVVSTLPSTQGASTATCLTQHWPSFASPEELSADPWGEYFRQVYGGTVPPAHPGVYPFCVGSLWWLYTDVLSASNVTNIPNITDMFGGRCPRNTSLEGERLCSPPHKYCIGHALSIIPTNTAQSITLHWTCALTRLFVFVHPNIGQPMRPPPPHSCVLCFVFVLVNKQIHLQQSILSCRFDMDLASVTAK